jgi:FkbM family methyltransferase
MYKNKTVIQIGSHIGNTQNDPIFKEIDETTQLVLVEPVKYLFDMLKDNYREKNVIFINKAVSDLIGEIELTVPSPKNDFSTLPVWASQLGSVDPYHATGHIPNLLVETIKVETTTIDQIIKDHDIKKIDLLHVDTEGHDYTILMNYSFTIKPQQVLFEHKHMDGLLKTGVRYIDLVYRLMILGYKKVYQNSEDSLFELI